MLQDEIFKEALSILRKYCSRAGRPRSEMVRTQINHILFMRGIMPYDHPMFATAFALTLRDLLQVWNAPLD